MSRLPEAPQAAASNTPPVPACLTSVPAEDAGGRGLFRGSLLVVEGIEPVDGWVLLCNAQSYETPKEHYARRGDQSVHIDVSRWDFAATQARFAWLAQNGFPRRVGKAPWNSRLIDAHVSAGAIQALDRETVEDLISDAISDSLDMDWQPGWGARTVLDALLREGLISIAEPKGAIQ